MGFWSGPQKMNAKYGKLLNKETFDLAFTVLHHFAL
jgi:hypothetical protein